MTGPENLLGTPPLPFFVLSLGRSRLEFGFVLDTMGLSNKRYISGTGRPRLGSHVCRPSEVSSRLLRGTSSRLLRLDPTRRTVYGGEYSLTLCS